MKSWQVIRQATEEIGVKALAAKLKVSPALVYKWCQEPSSQDPEASGARNPLDRLAQIVLTTGDTAPILWLCQQIDGYFVLNPPVHCTRSGADLLRNTQCLVHEFSDLLTTVTQSIQDDGQIETKEAALIREKWELLKSTGESFVVACEAGSYYQPREKNRG